MFYIGRCGAKIEVYEDPDGEVIIQCAMGRSMCDSCSLPIAEVLCDDCNYFYERTQENY